MPERVSKEERVISLTIEKAREAKELLRESMEGNRLPDEKDDRMEQVKTKRPKAEKDKTKIENNTGTHSGYGLAGETTQFKKSMRPMKQQMDMINSAFDRSFEKLSNKMTSAGTSSDLDARMMDDLYGKMEMDISELKERWEDSRRVANLYLRAKRSNLRVDEENVKRAEFLLKYRLENYIEMRLSRKLNDNFIVKISGNIARINRRR
jgi:hypothetical protein